MGKTSESITALNSLLEMSPTDSEAWAELADMYLSQGMYNQAIFALEEALVLTPNAWNVRTQLPELLCQYLTKLGACSLRRGFIDGCQFDFRRLPTQALR